MYTTTRAMIAYAIFFGLLFTASAQSDAPQCVMSCLSTSAQAAGCSAPEDWKCACKDSSFQPSANTCFQQSCSNADMLIGESMVDTGCSNEASTSIPPPFSSPTSPISSSLTVTDSETSPPESSPSSGHPTRTSDTLVPPTPPPSTTLTNTATQPVSISTPFSTGSSGTPSPSSISSITNGTGTATNTTLAMNSTSNAFTPSTGTFTVSSGTIQPAPSTSSNGALYMAVHGEKVIGGVLVLAGLWAFF